MKLLIKVLLFTLLSNSLFAQAIVKANISLSTIADLRTQVAQPNEEITVLGSSSVTDGNGANYLWNSSSTATDDGISVIQVTGVNTGRWTLVRKSPQSITGFAGSPTKFSPKGTYANLSVVSYGSRAPFVTGQFSDGVATVEVSRFHHIAIGNISDLHIMYCNFPGIAAATTDANPSTDITISCSIEYPAGTYTNAYFNGSASYLLKLQQTYLTDAIPICIPNGADFWIKTSVTVTSGQKWCRTHATNSTFNEGVTANSAVLNSTVTNSTTFCFGPAAVLGTSTTYKGSILWPDDSIGTGQNDSGTGYVTIAPYLQAGGILNRAFLQGYPTLMCNVAGQKLAYYNPATTSSSVGNFSALFSTCQFAISNLGTNDIGANTTAQMQQMCINFWCALKAKGLITYQGTIIVKTTSTDVWATTQNQTVTAAEAVRLAVNAWLLAGAPYNYVTLTPASGPGTNIVSVGSPYHALSGVLDFNNIVDPTASGKWPAGGTSDGIHPLSAIYILLGNYLQTFINNKTFDKY